jgi:hypothetical protein
MDRQYVGIDFHHRRSVIVRLDAAREQLAVTRVDNDPFKFAAVMADAGEAPAVVIEAPTAGIGSSICSRSSGRRLGSRACQP